ncbi:hypothetical protein [Scytonema sp. NUACC21]
MGTASPVWVTFWHQSLKLIAVSMGSSTVNGIWVAVSVIWVVLKNTNNDFSFSAIGKSTH